MEEERQPEQETSSKSGNLITSALSIATKLWGTKTKIIIVIAAIGILFSALILLLLFGSILFFFTDSDTTNTEGNLSYSSIGDDSGFWWPIGSNETTTKNGVTFASGEPALTSISSHFSSNRCLGGTCRAHYGFDVGSGGVIGKYNLIAVKSGTIVQVYNGCADNGSLENTCGGQLGNYVTIDHGNGYYSRYQHMAKDSVTVKVGDTVQQGQVIGKIGKSGRCTGAHLHFQIHVGGMTNSYAVDPLTYVDPNDPRPKSSNVIVKDNVTVFIGDSVEQTVCLTLKNAGFSDGSIGAVMGNMSVESGGFQLDAINELDCRGLIQWCFGRKNTLLTRYGNNWDKVENQLDLFFDELYNEQYYAGVKKSLESNNSVDSKTYKFCMVFEAPGEQYCKSGKRQGLANTYYTYAKNGCK